MPASNCLPSYSHSYRQSRNSSAMDNGISLRIDITSQTLCVIKATVVGTSTTDDTEIIYPVSTAAKGAGEINGSGCTPRGQHIIRAKIGDNQPVNSIFIGRRPCGEIYHPHMQQRYPHRDWILTRILWLSGCQPGFNRLGKVDTMRRYIYIHGTPDEVILGKPSSAGCIRMRNQDLLALYDRVTVGSNVTIHT